ncbi:MAG: hypothetical protein ACR2PK_16615 [Acidimicrobiales bacterium]
MTLLHTLAGISWEPEIRGILVVLVGSAVLMGSIWLILATNIGARLGTLNALAAFFGWMVIMGLVWWIYGGNVLRGEDPTWEPTEVVFGDLDEAVTGDVSDLADSSLPAAAGLVEQYCPGLVDATVELQRARVVENNLDLTLATFYVAPEGSEYCNNEQLGELLAVDAETLEEELRARNEALDPDDPRYLTEEELDAFVEVAIDDEIRKLNQLTLSGLVTVSPGLVAAAEADGVIVLVDWNLVSNADAGEAQTTAGAFLIEGNNSPFDSAADFIVLDTFQQGGKPERASGSTWDRLANEFRNTVVFWHPTNTIVVQVVRTLDKEPVAGQAPPFAEIDQDAEVVSVVMVRDLGSRRLPAALITLGSLTIFLVLIWMLHARDIELRRRVAEWDPSAAT